jgi:CRISPR system Cascade subunit CasA
VNLVKDPWLPFRLRDGNEQILPITAICNPEVEDFALPRADFQGAAYQFAIGLLQTVFAPSDRYQWKERYQQPPSASELQQVLDRAAHAFNVTGESPLFMQDFDPLNDVKAAPVAGLLIDAPGGNGIKLNTDHFVKRGIGEIMSLETAIIALFTLQINAPSGGQGHRTGLRGGGPLTTLVMPPHADSSLWQKLWFNVINREYWRYPDPDLHSTHLFPWLGSTQTSEKGGTEIYQSDVHELHMYWAMPRRIRLIITDNTGECRISGRCSQQTVTALRTQNYGGNYAGSWSHPLTPYKWYPKNPEKEHLSLKGQPGGITYKTWDALTLSGEINNGKEAQIRASVVSAYSKLHVARILDSVAEVPRLWVFGYDMDNMKARCWYSVMMPLLAIEDDQQEDVLLLVKELQQLANDTLWQCRTQVKSAWFDRPGEASGDFTFVDLAFWQRTESRFFHMVQTAIENAIDNDPFLTPQQANEWLQILRTTATDIFDEFALSELGSERSMAKRIKARQNLSGWLYGSKQIKNFIKENKIESLKEAV